MKAKQAMFKDAINRMLGKGSTKGLTADAKALYTCLEVCEKAEEGLTTRIVNYIETGDDRPVLSVLTTKKSAVNQALMQRRHEWAARDKTGKTNRYDAHPDEGLLSQLLCRTHLQPDRALRMAEIGGLVIQPVMPQFYMHINTANGFDVPAAAQFLFETAVSAEFADTPAEQRLTFEDIMAISARLGATREVVIASGYWKRWTGNRWNSTGAGMGVHGHRWLTEADHEEFYRGTQKLDANGRDAMLEFCRAHNLHPKGDCLDLWFRFSHDGSAKVREHARQLILATDDPRREAMAIEGLDNKTAAYRSAMIQILGSIGSDAAKEALQARLKVEKTRSVQLLLEQFLSLTEAPAYDSGRPGYEAIDGTWIDTPEVLRLEESDEKPFGKADEAALKAIAEEEFTKELERWKKRKETTNYYAGNRPEIDTRWKTLLAVCNGEKAAGQISNWRYQRWLQKEISRIPPARIARIWAQGKYHSGIHLYGDEPATGWIIEQLESEMFDLRTVVDISEEADQKLRAGKNDGNSAAEDGGVPARERAFLSMLNNLNYTLNTLPKSAVWPLIADHLPVVAENLPPHGLDTTQNLRAIRLLERLPALPRALLPNLVAASTAGARSVRVAAQNLLRDVDGITPQIVSALTDSRQGIRANAASFLGQRGDKSVLPELIKQAAKDKSDAARAAMISAVAALGGDTSKWLGQAVLEKEAATGVVKLKGDKIDWLDTSTAPVLRWSDGTQVSADLLPGWLRLAVKLKSLEDGAGLFALYLDQLEARSAVALGDWILSAWVAHDSYRRPREEVFREQLVQAKEYVDRARTNAQNSYYRDRTPEQVATEWTNHIQSNYPNSGADSKGILALSLRATPTIQSRLIAGYLKEHGRRVAQAKALLDLLAYSGSPEALQIVVATATRFKQRSVREAAELLVARIAEERDWSADELADRSVPSGGLDENGVLDLPLGDEAKPYQARIGSDLDLHLYNPEGRVIKSLPAGTDDNTKESKAALSLAKKTIKTVTQQQSRRLYEAMLSSRRWLREDWENDLRNHPIMLRLTERVIWRGLDIDGKAVTSFRPTSEGDLLTADGDDADLADVVQIDLAHGATIPQDSRDAWLQHLKDFETEPLFAQISRPVLSVGENHKQQFEIDDRKGWMLENLKLRGLAGKLGYDQGETMDGGSFMEYEKRFPSAGIMASIQFSGSYHGADIHPVALTGLRFARLTESGRPGRDARLSDVPPLLLSECWNDFHDIAAAGAFDPEWEKKGLW